MIASASILLLSACNDQKSSSTTSTNSDSTLNSTNTASSSYAAADGDVKFTGNKLMVMKNGTWVEADNDIKLESGVTIYRDGRVERDDYQIELRDGEMVNKSGDFFDRTGSAISNAWDATKEGASDAGRAVKKGFNKVGQKIESAIDKDTTD